MHRPFPSIIMFDSFIPPVVSAILLLDEIIELCFIEHLLYTRSCAKRFVPTISFSHHNDLIGGDYYYPHFIGEEIETQRGRGTGLRPHSDKARSQS